MCGFNPPPVGFTFVLSGLIGKRGGDEGRREEEVGVCGIVGSGE